MAIANEMLNKWFSGAPEYAVDELADHLAKHAMLGARGTIHKCTIGAAHLEVPLALENPHHSHHSRVGNLPPRTQCFVHVAHGRAVSLPHDFHDFQFLLSEDGRCLRHVY